ncbi:hypothetical protein, partial [Bdellovibrio sp.]|uniref:hypothetical protein n=1 Tax=Bdellovibrio sp. TaxID=28201 RepID=UPI0032219B5E
QFFALKFVDNCLDLRIPPIIKYLDLPATLPQNNRPILAPIYLCINFLYKNNEIDLQAYL